MSPTNAITIETPIRAAFTKAKQENRAAFIPYVMLGYPDASTSIALAQAIAAAGADILELGVPFSDPLADGATIQHASQLSLEQGTTLKQCCEMAKIIAATTTIPLIFMGYYNPFLRMGLSTACQTAAASGVSGLIIPDVPAEEAPVLTAAAAPHGIQPIFLVTPTSPERRIASVAAAAQTARSGFVYVVSLSGVTGARSQVATDLPTMLTRVRQYTGDLPLGVGFGISTPAQAKEVAQLADGVVVASALINAFDSAPDGEKIPTAVALAQSLRAAVQRG